jgi:hypothetical protein
MPPATPGTASGFHNTESRIRMTTFFYIKATWYGGDMDDISDINLVGPFDTAVARDAYIEPFQSSGDFRFDDKDTLSLVAAGVADSLVAPVLATPLCAYAAVFGVHDNGLCGPSNDECELADNGVLTGGDGIDGEPADFDAVLDDYLAREQPPG